MGITWILCANRSRARLFEVKPHADTPTEVADFANPAGRTHERDLRSDAAGRVYGAGGHQQAHAASGSDSATLGEHETEKFAESLRDYLVQAHTGQRFGQLWVAAAPAFLGILRHKLTKEVAHTVEFELDKDFTEQAPRDIFRHLIQARGEHAGKGASGA